jgi:hypothetical protein
MDEERNEYHFWNEKTWKGAFLISSVMFNGQRSNMHFSVEFGILLEGIYYKEGRWHTASPLSNIIPASQPPVPRTQIILYSLPFFPPITRTHPLIRWRRIQRLHFSSFNLPQLHPLDIPIPSSPPPNNKHSSSNGYKCRKTKKDPQHNTHGRLYFIGRA